MASESGLGYGGRMHPTSQAVSYRRRLMRRPQPIGPKGRMARCSHSSHLWESQVPAAAGTTCQCGASVVVGVMTGVRMWLGTGPDEMYRRRINTDNGVLPAHHPQS